MRHRCLRGPLLPRHHRPDGHPPRELARWGEGIAYIPQTLIMSGGTSPYAFTVTAGALPGCLTLATTGTLSGTPTAVGTSTFTVTATDANSFTRTQQYTIAVTRRAIGEYHVAPNQATIKVGQVQQVTATGTYAESGLSRMSQGLPQSR